jgi:hypothetical protein
MPEIKKLPPFPVGLKKPIQIIYNDPEKNKNRFGRMIYGHKTAGEVCIMTGEQFADFKSYEPGKCGISSIKTRSKSSTNLGGDLS